MPMSANGMQRCLDDLKPYCDKWHIEIGLKRTKIIVLNKSGKLPKCTNFYFCGKNWILNKTINILLFPSESNAKNWLRPQILFRFICQISETYFDIHNCEILNQIPEK